MSEHVAELTERLLRRRDAGTSTLTCCRTQESRCPSLTHSLRWHSPPATAAAAAAAFSSLFTLHSTPQFTHPALFPSLVCVAATSLLQVDSVSAPRGEPPSPPLLARHFSGESVDVETCSPSLPHMTSCCDVLCGDRLRTGAQ